MMQPATLALRCRAVAPALPRFFSANLSTKCSGSISLLRQAPAHAPASRRALATSSSPFTFTFVASRFARRHASTATASSSGAAAAAAPGEPLTWNRFLALRKTRRRISLASSIVCAVIVTAAGLSFITGSDFDSTAAQTLGLDPIAVLGISTVGLGCVGWLIGPMFGNAVFNVAYRSYRPQIGEKERAFFERIKKHRVDPSNSSIANPVPDYYGEKIGSVGDYRKWLKDQRAFNLKRGRSV